MSCGMLIPIYVAELMFSHSPFKSHSDIECSASRYGTADTRHGDDGYILDLHVRRGFGYKHETFV